MDVTFEKLKEAKSSIKIFGLDYDGTIVDGVDFKLPEAIGLIEKIIDSNKSVAFITARAATALKILVPSIQELIASKKNHPSCFISGGNGANLYEIKSDSLVSIYNHGLDLTDIEYIVTSVQNIYKELGITHNDLVEKGIETFRKFLKDNWNNYIPQEIFDLCLTSDGEFFTEEAKVTFVLPKEKATHQALVKQLNKALREQYQVLAGDETYLHITKRLAGDGKKLAIETILSRLHLNEKEVITFGDMPQGNDAGLLSFPFSFTNSDEFAKTKEDNSGPPYVLCDSELTPVARVHKIINYLVS
jgi:hydroxymethylpyrimidine pyrophosphatase-like HAD family hydrolase